MRVPRLFPGLALVWLILTPMAGAGPGVLSRDVSVPEANLGDVAIYQYWVDDVDGPSEGMAALRVEDLERVADADGARHQSVPFHWDGPTTNTGWLKEGATSQARVHFELGARVPIRREGVHPSNENLSEPSLFVSLGPGHSGDPDALRDPLTLWTRLQGRTLQEGTDLSNAIGDLRRAQWSRLTNWGPSWIAGVAFHHDARVAERGSLDGIDVTAVRVQEDIAWDDDDGKRYALRVDEAHWFSQRSAYPELFEVTIERTIASEEAAWSLDGRVGFDEVRHPDIGGPALRWSIVARLAEVRPGLTPIPWGAVSVDPAPAREATTGSYPATGPGPSDLRLEEEAAAVLSDPTLVAFRVWRMQHPDAVLVGAHVSEHRWPQDTSPSERWPCPVDNRERAATLWFGDPGTTSAFVLTRFAPCQTQTPVTVEAGPFFGACELPEALRLPAAHDWPTYVTQSAIWERFQDIEDVGDPEPPSYMLWGFAWLYQCGTVQAGGDAPEVSLAIPTGASADELLRHLHIARWQDGAGLAFRGVDADVASGTVFFAESYRLKPRSMLIEEVAEGPFDLPGRPDTTAASPSRPVYAIAPWAGLGLLTLGLAGYFAPLIKYGAAALYTRLTRSEILDNGVREALLTSIKTTPGISPPALKKATRAGWSTIVYHLGVLEKNGLVTSVIDGRHKRFFPTGTFHASDIHALAVVQNAKTRLIYDAIRKKPGIERTELADLIEVTPHGTRWHLERLEEAGLVESIREGRAIKYRAKRELDTTVPADAVAA